MQETKKLSQIIEGVKDGNNAAIARAITLIENDSPDSSILLDSIYPYTGRAAIIGITGPPGAGKSTLIENLGRYWLENGIKLGIIAVDPTSPFTGGAILGDRIRMNSISSAPNAFIRSMATRGSLGGLSPKIKEAVQVLDAGGFDIILLETVGVGQSEVDIVKVADTVILVTVPEAGDDIQVLKSGVMEIGDIFVVNKADRPGCEKMKILLEAMLKLGKNEGWHPPVLKAVASKGEGIIELAGEINKHIKFLKNNKKGMEKQFVRTRELLINILKERFDREILYPWTKTEDFKRAVIKLAQRKETPFLLLKKIIRENEKFSKIFPEEVEENDN